VSQAKNLGGAREQGGQVTAGSWRGRDFTGTDYVDAVRGDLNDRLSRLGLA
jgi:hypothetical protein